MPMQNKVCLCEKPKENINKLNPTDVLGDAHVGLFPQAHRHLARDLVKGTRYNLDPVVESKGLQTNRTNLMRKQAQLDVLFTFRLKSWLKISCEALRVSGGPRFHSWWCSAGSNTRASAQEWNLLVRSCFRNHVMGLWWAYVRLCWSFGPHLIGNI